MQPKPLLGVLGGSGLYGMEALKDVVEHEAETPFGKPSSPVLIGSIGDKRVAFIARHGFGHNLSPAQVPYRANIYALKMLGVEKVISVSACGSLREDYAPGDVVVPDQLFDLTHDRERTFFNEGIVAHVNVAEPYCSQLSQELVECVREVDGRVHPSGAYLTIPGPRFSTRAESNTYRAWGMSIIGMTTSPEAFLAREAEMCYAVMAHVTDYDVWHTTEAPVTVGMVIRTFEKNISIAQAALVALISRLPKAWECACGNALSDALITAPENIPANIRQKVALLVDPYLP
jgi:5'-methylthioadenosine phosphorylase